MGEEVKMADRKVRRGRQERQAGSFRDICRRVRGAARRGRQKTLAIWQEC
jgi:hypothetical protein